MILNLKKLFSDEQETLLFAYGLDLSSADINGFMPFVSPVSVRGVCKKHDGFITLEAKASFDFSIPCDRCTAQLNRHFDYDFSHFVVRFLERNDDEEYVEVRDDKLDLDELIRADILLELPSKYLCSDNCKGLCPMCGKNLNEGSCGCDTHQPDPRLEILKKLID